MASAHLFREPGVTRFLLPRVGGFSINREGTDREALKTAIDILATARRPLVVFPEGVLTRTNDRIIHLQDGVSFIARSAAKQRAAASPAGKVVIHPVALRYTFMGDLEQSLTPVLDQIEARLSWQPRTNWPMRERTVAIGHALLALKEIEYHGEARTGPVPERLSALVDAVLGPIEREWLSGRSDGGIIMRVKNLRKAILPELVTGELREADRARRWKLLFDLEVAQQMFHFPPEYVGENPKPERLIETVERYEEALGNPNPTIHRPMHLTITIGEPIDVAPARDKRAPGDPVMDRVRESLEHLLGIQTRHDEATAS
jgi:Acyltransferase